MYVDTTSINSEVRRLVEAVGTLQNSGSAGERITVSKLAEYLNIGKMAASRRAARAVREGWLVNKEIRKGYPSDFIIGEPMPETEGLPDLTTVTPLQNEVLQQNSFKNGDCNTVTPLTGRNKDTMPLTSEGLNCPTVSPPTVDNSPPVSLSPEEIIRLWKAEGKPVIHLGPGQNCENLELLLSRKDLPVEYKRAIKKWAEEIKYANTQVS
jgi:hypothetical protein